MTRCQVHLPLSYYNTSPHQVFCLVPEETSFMELQCLFTFYKCLQNLKFSVHYEQKSYTKLSRGDVGQRKVKCKKGEDIVGDIEVEDVEEVSKENSGISEDIICCKDALLWPHLFYQESAILLPSPLLSPLCSFSSISVLKHWHY